MEEITFSVPGNPIPQPRIRVSTRGGRGRAYVPASHPVHVYRQAIALAAKAAGCRPNDNDIEFEVEAIFARPKSHYKAAGELTAKAPRRPPKCDWDNIGKAVSDALKGVAWADDDQVIDGRVRRRYGRRREPARTVITIRRLS